MDRNDIAKLFLMLTMLGALVLSAVRTPASAETPKDCLFFPQFTAAAASSKDTDTDTEITYTFGITELFSHLRRA